MKRAGLSIVVLVAALALGCAGSDSVPTAPSAPSTPTPPSTTPPPTPPPSNSCKPAAPTNFQIATNGSARTFTWNAVNNAVDYFIQVGSISGASDLLNTNTTHTSYNWNGYGPGEYYARVYARNSCGSGPNSTELAFR